MDINPRHPVLPEDVNSAAEDEGAGLVSPLDTHKAAISHPHEKLHIPDDLLPAGHANGSGLLDLTQIDSLELGNASDLQA